MNYRVDLDCGPDRQIHGQPAWRARCAFLRAREAPAKIQKRHFWVGGGSELPGRPRLRARSSDSWSGLRRVSAPEFPAGRGRALYPSDGARGTAGAACMAPPPVACWSGDDRRDECGLRDPGVPISRRRALSHGRIPCATSATEGTDALTESPADLALRDASIVRFFARARRRQRYKRHFE